MQQPQLFSQSRSRKRSIVMFIIILFLFVLAGLVVRNYSTFRERAVAQFLLGTSFDSNISQAPSDSTITIVPEKGELSETQISFLPVITQSSTTNFFIAHVSPAPFATEVSPDAQIRIQLSTDQWDPKNIDRFIRVLPGITGRIEKQKTDLVFIPDVLP
ncbi:MAG: hypothetical protein A3G01_03025 [Candidatus Kerfeldbacteria bacterium RIFCSPLOWO2_12_FULL_43_9]|nr:MAG: hypothetical protein A3G01_03025 [Candidatus Kerfeldbacteria bacterium RIFCSPLOWO2_12_FULL_43_9]